MYSARLSPRGKFMVVQSYKQLIAWQKAVDLVVAVYKLSEQFPRSELYGLSSQIRKAAVSVPSNIAEGQARLSTGEFRQFLGNARGSVVEVQTQVLSLSDSGLSMRWIRVQ